MKKLLTASLIATMTVTSGCATQTALLKPTANTTANYDKGQTFFIAGIGQEKTVDAAQVCGGQSRVAKVESMQSPKDALLGFLTLGIYTPRTAKVYCQ